MVLLSGESSSTLTILLTLSKDKEPALSQKAWQQLMSAITKHPGIGAFFYNME